MSDTEWWACLLEAFSKGEPKSPGTCKRWAEAMGQALAERWAEAQAKSIREGQANS